MVELVEDSRFSTVSSRKRFAQKPVCGSISPPTVTSTLYVWPCQFGCAQTPNAAAFSSAVHSGRRYRCAAENVTRRVSVARMRQYPHTRAMPIARKVCPAQGFDGPPVMIGSPGVAFVPR